MTMGGQWEGFTHLIGRTWARRTDSAAPWGRLRGGNKEGRYRIAHVHGEPMKSAPLTSLAAHGHGGRIPPLLDLWGRVL